MLHLFFLVARTSLAWYFRRTYFDDKSFRRTYLYDSFSNFGGNYLDAIKNRWLASLFKTIIMIFLYLRHVR